MASIEQRKNRHGVTTSWRVVWMHQGRKLSQTVDTEEAAKKWKHIIEAAAGDPAKAEAALLSQFSTAPKFADVAKDHVKRLINVQPYTVKTYERYIRLHLHNLADLPVDQITEDDMIRWVKAATAAKASPKSIRNTHGFIHAVFNGAARRGLRTDNPCSGDYLPDMNTVDSAAVFLTTAQFWQLMEYVPKYFHPFFGLLFGTGLRLGEASALTPADFVLDGTPPVVRVSKAWKRQENDQYVIGPPKSAAGRRTVSLAGSTVALIRERVESTPPGELVFTMTQGGKIIPSNIHKQVWGPAVKAAMAAKGTLLTERPRIHDLRHSHASVMIALGANLFELAARLGHESVQTTTQVYGHLVPGAHFRTAQIAEQALGGVELVSVEE